CWTVTAASAGQSLLLVLDSHCCQCWTVTAASAGSVVSSNRECGQGSGVHIPTTRLSGGGGGGGGGGVLLQTLRRVGCCICMRGGGRGGLSSLPHIRGLLEMGHG
ncbi:hypothetical protein FHG87_022071, partial [Trinorchestia longiramus]